MNSEEKNKYIHSFLRIMADSIEKEGISPQSSQFNFTPGDSPERDSKWLKAFKERTPISKNDFVEVFNYCLTHGYIKRFVIGNPFFISLTSAGFEKAGSPPDIITSNNHTSSTVNISHSNVVMGSSRMNNVVNNEKSKSEKRSYLTEIIIGVIVTVVGGLVLYLLKIN